MKNPTPALYRMLPIGAHPSSPGRCWAGVGTLLVAVLIAAACQAQQTEHEVSVGMLISAGDNDQYNNGAQYREIPVCRRGTACWRTLCSVEIDPFDPVVDPEAWLITGSANVTNRDLRRRKLNAGFTVETWVCDDLEDCRRIGQSGGSNVTTAQHHEAIQRVTFHAAQPGDSQVKLVGRAYNLKARRDRLRIDGCTLQVLRMQP